MSLFYTDSAFPRFDWLTVKNFIVFSRWTNFTSKSKGLKAKVTAPCDGQPSLIFEPKLHCQVCMLTTDLNGNGYLSPTSLEYHFWFSVIVPCSVTVLALLMLYTWGPQGAPLVLHVSDMTLIEVCTHFQLFTSTEWCYRSFFIYGSKACV